MGGSKNKRVNFNDTSSAEEVVKNLSKQMPKDKKPLMDKIVNFVSANMMLVAILAVYFVVSGIVANIKLIINHPFIALPILALIALLIYFKQLKNKK